MEGEEKSTGNKERTEGRGRKKGRKKDDEEAEK